MRRLPLILVVMAACLALPGAALAAYAPKLTAVLEPATPSTLASISTTVTQAAGETPSKTVMVTFPIGFSVPLIAPDLTACTADQEAARACPDGSHMGDANATANVLGLSIPLSGGVYYGGLVGAQEKLIVFLDNSQVNQHVTVEGLAGLRSSDNAFQATFDNLPNTLTTSFTLKLLGGSKALSVTPATCGDYSFTGGFTSQKGETATSQAPIKITGCTPAKLVLSPLDIEPSPATSKRGATLTFNLTEPASATVTVTRGGKRVLHKVLAGRTGTNHLKALGKGYKAGKYVVTVAAVTSDGRAATPRHKTLTIARTKAKAKTG